MTDGAARTRNQSSSLRRALAVLNYVRENAGGRGVTLTRIADGLGMSKSTVLRLAVPLVEIDLLARDHETGWFRLGHGTLRLAQAYLSSLDLRTVAAEPLRRLQHAVGETCHLVVYDPPDVVYIDKIENERNVRMASRIGSRTPAYRTAVGKAVLAWLNDEALQTVIDAGLPPVTERTITDPRLLRAELAQVRRRGYAVDDRENEPEVRCVAAPIFDHTEGVVGALSVSALVSRMPPARIREIGPLIAMAGQEVSRALGAFGPGRRRRAGGPEEGRRTMGPRQLTPPRELIDWRTTGVWRPGEAVPLEEFAAARHPLFGGPFSWPVMVAKKVALDHNVATLAAFCARHGLEFAPHGKTTMAPSLFEAQLKAGAWGITTATANQVLACRSLGVPRVLLANELLDSAALRWVVDEVERGFEFLCYVDSVAGVRAMADSIAMAPGTRPLRVLAELGYRGGRTGCRSIAELLEVARAVIAAPRLRLAGVAGYEGELGSPEQVAGYLDRLRSATLELAAAQLLPPDKVIVTAGGSAYFDLVAERLGGSWLPGLRTILRSGAYVSHDDGLYREKTPFTRIPGSLDAALEIWAQVTSAPEPERAIVGMGKREAPYDAGLPVPLRVRRRDGRTAPAAGLRVVKLNDHHGYVEGPGVAGLEPGDLICFGVSHPCTAFDKWQVVPVVDDDYTVTDLIRTYF